MFNFLKSNKVSKSKLKIISGYNFRYRNVGKHSEKTIIKYANYFKFDYEIIKNIKFERHFYWLKIKAIIDNLKSKKHEYIFWIDADAFFCKYENILKHIDKKKHIHIVNHLVKSVHKTNYKNTNYLTWGPNVGVILVKNTKWSLDFFQKVWNKTKYLDHYWPDNAAFLDVIGFKAEISKLSDNKPSKSILSKFEFLPGTWNSMPKKNYLKPDDTELSNFYFDPIIIHLAGMRRKNRINFIKKYNKLFIK